MASDQVSTDTGRRAPSWLGRRLGRWTKWLKYGGLAAAAMAMVGFSQSALALPNFTIIAPNEFIRLPMVKKPVWFYFQTGIYDRINSAFDANGGTVHEPTTRIYAGLSRFGQIEPAINLGNVQMGWAWEYLQPYSSVQPEGAPSESGLGDPIVLVGEYFRPNFKAFNRDFDVTVGFWPVLSMPFGNNNTALSSHAWLFFPTIIGDISTGPVGVNFTIGAKISSDQHMGGGVRQSFGNQYFIQSDLHYRATKWLGLAIMNFYNVAEATNFIGNNGHVIASKVGTPVSGNAQCSVSGQGCIEDLIGPSVTLYFNPMNWISAWYYTPLAFIGHNNAKDKAVMFRFVHLWTFD